MKYQISIDEIREAAENSGRDYKLVLAYEGSAESFYYFEMQYGFDHTMVYQIAQKNKFKNEFEFKFASKEDANDGTLDRSIKAQEEAEIFIKNLLR